MYLFIFEKIAKTLNACNKKRKKKNPKAITANNH